jgi:hypothetical protein
MDVTEFTVCLCSMNEWVGTVYLEVEINQPYKKGIKRMAG